jgi:hypothetical protein
MIGEPDAGKPHVRFDEGTQETGGDVPRLRPTLLGSPICTAAYIVARTAHNPREESTFRRLTGGNVRWASRRWRTRLFNRRW